MMVKLFGKIRYFWQPDIAFGIAYWCVAISIGVVSVIFTLEETRVYWGTIAILLFFLVFCVYGFHHHFWIEKEKECLHVVSLRRKYRATIAISSITKLLVSSHGVVIFSSVWKRGRMVFMWKWFREPFVQQLTNCPTFCGKVKRVKKFK